MIAKKALIKTAPLHWATGWIDGSLTIVIGKGGKGISEADAMKHVWGYTAINDVTARDWQQRHKQWFLGKSFDTFCPMGPWVVTANEVDAQDITVKCWVNGELRQNSNTKDLIFEPFCSINRTQQCYLPSFPWWC